MNVETLESTSVEAQELQEFKDAYRTPVVLELFERLDVMERAGIPTPPVDYYRPYADSNVTVGNILASEAPGGSFKVRGAVFAALKAYEDGAETATTASAGNHGQGLAYATHLINMQNKVSKRAPFRTIIDMPASTPDVKKNGVERLGGGFVDIDLTSNSFEEAQKKALLRANQNPETTKFISPFNNYDVISGQGTAVLQALIDNPEADELHVGVGGGGLSAGVLEAVVALKNEGLINPDLKVVMVMLEGNDNFFQTQRNNWVPSPASAVDTLTEGAAVLRPGDIPAFMWGMYEDHIEREFVTKDDMARELLAIEDRNYKRGLKGEKVYPIPETTTLAILAGTSKRALKHDLEGSGKKQYLTLSTGKNADPAKLRELYVRGDELSTLAEEFSKKIKTGLSRSSFLGGQIGLGNLNKNNNNFLSTPVIIVDKRS
jgi:threonine dehydratase